MATVEVPSQRKSSYDPAGDVTVHVTNDLGYNVAVAWVNYDGQAQPMGAIAAGSSWSQNTNSEHPWLISKTDGDSELACCCFKTAGSINMSSILTAALPARQEKPGYLHGGGDFVAGVSQEEAERLVASNPGTVMGYCYRHENPASCWVKVCGTGFSEAKGWTTVVFEGSRDNAQALHRKKHNIFEMNEEVPTGECRWQDYCADNVTCAAMNKCYVPHEVEGLRFFIEQGCFEKYPELRELISGDVMEIKRLLPEAAFTLLKGGTAVWINDVLQYPGEAAPRSGAWCHCGPWFPVSKGDLEQKGNCVEICQCAHYVNWVRGQPSIILHELSHAYHNLRRPEIDSIIQTAYQQAMASGIYNTEERGGTAGRRKPYCATNHSEYFAESSEAFWSSTRFHNDYFPYVHAELKGFDPIGYKMCEAVWGVEGCDLPSRAEVPEKWLQQFAKIPIEKIKKAFEAADLDKSGHLDENEFGAAIVSVLGSGMTLEEVQAMATFADADKDGAIQYAEFATWLTSVSGAYVKSA